MGNPVVHIEIPVTDFQKAKDFYSKIFRWKINYIPAMNYAMFDPGTPPRGGFIKVDKITKGGPLIYIQVDDIEKKLKEIEKAGGRTMKKKSEIPQTGWEATFTDISGNVLGLFTPMKE